MMQNGTTKIPSSRSMLAHHIEHTTYHVQPNDAAILFIIFNYFIYTNSEAITSTIFKYYLQNDQDYNRNKTFLG